jgi:hypothetical protein
MQSLVQDDDNSENAQYIACNYVLQYIVMC